MEGFRPGEEWKKTRAIQSWFPTGRMVVGVLGSATFYNPLSPSLCRYIGEALYKSGIILFAAKSTGISEMIAWSYTYTGGNNAAKTAFHLDISTSKQTGDVIEKSYIGSTIAGAKTEEEQLFLFPLITPVYLLIEGGPRSAMMARIAMEHGAVIIPLSFTGGAACGLFGAPFFPKPNCVSLEDWLALRDPTGDVEYTADCTVRIIQALYNSTE